MACKTLPRFQMDRCTKKDWNDEQNDIFALAACTFLLFCLQVLTGLFLWYYHYIHFEMQTPSIVLGRNIPLYPLEYLHIASIYCLTLSWFNKIAQLFTTKNYLPSIALLFISKSVALVDWFATISSVSAIKRLTFPYSNGI